MNNRVAYLIAGARKVSSMCAQSTKAQVGPGVKDHVYFGTTFNHRLMHKLNRYFQPHTMGELQRLWRETTWEVES